MNTANIEPGKTAKRCPFCAELIRYEAVKCRFCGEFLRSHRRLDLAAPPDDGSETEDGGEDDHGILYAGSPSILALSRSLTVTALVLVLAGGLLFYPVANLLDWLPGLDLSERQMLDFERHARTVAILLAAAAMLFALWKIAVLKSINYEVTPDRIEYARGLFSRKIDNMDMFRIVDLKLDRSVPDRLLGTGTVRVITRDESDPAFDFVKVRHPKYLYDVLKKASLQADRRRGVVHVE